MFFEKKHLEMASQGVHMNEPSNLQKLAAEVIGRMCAPRRSDRYATLAEALDDLAICEV